MRVSGTADSAHVEGGESGFELHVETNVGDFVFNIHSFAEAFAANVDREIGDWLREGDAARATMPSRITEDDLDAYPLGDPKRITLEQEMNR